MSPRSKDEHKLVVDVAAWTFNITTSVGVIIVNKALMATYGFTFGIYKIIFSFCYIINYHGFIILLLICFAATTLTGLHFAATTIMTLILKLLGYIQPSHLPVPDILKFVVFANFSIVGMNVSLMWNSVGFYQVHQVLINSNNII